MITIDRFSDKNLNLFYFTYLSFLSQVVVHSRVLTKVLNIILIKTKYIWKISLCDKRR